MGKNKTIDLIIMMINGPLNIVKNGAVFYFVNDAESLSPVSGQQANAAYAGYGVSSVLSFLMWQEMKALREHRCETGYYDDMEEEEMMEEDAPEDGDEPEDDGDADP